MARWLQIFITLVSLIVGFPVAFAAGYLAHWLEDLSGSRYAAYAVGAAGVACFFLVAKLLEPRRREEAQHP
ncbi:hypothetical protein [Methylobacterium sp. J-070]|uniref:hypothetical protein n=1 Tax=Methylobacterium sp. J-070 TaxID=2836650 RepID=UPI001FB9DA83|nr:hypothetical protein [Methylobacterium sp. J-070]MCJ2049334.1 hypothetical protein [Methylobacterium sp. J-070]